MKGLRRRIKVCFLLFEYTNYLEKCCHCNRPPIFLITGQVDCNKLLDDSNIRVLCLNLLSVCLHILLSFSESLSVSLLDYAVLEGAT